MPKDHYVPKFYLRNFEINGSFCVIDKIQKKSWKSSALKTTRKDHFYTFHEISGKQNQETEGILSERETRWHRVIARILETGELPDNRTSRTQLLEFVAIQYLRTPHFVQKMRAAMVAVQEAQLESSAQDPKVVAKFISQHPDCDEESFRRMIKETRFEVSRGSDVIHALAQTYKVYPSLREKGALLVTVPDDMELLTSDNPVNVWLPGRGILGGGIQEREAQIWCPLSSEMGLYLGPPEPISGRDRADFCDEMNQRMIVDAERFLISPSHSEDLESQVFKAPGPFEIEKEALHDLAIQILENQRR